MNKKLPTPFLKEGKSLFTPLSLGEGSGVRLIL